MQQVIRYDGDGSLKIVKFPQPT